MLGNITKSLNTKFIIGYLFPYKLTLTYEQL